MFESRSPADVEISQKHKVTGVDISQTQIGLARQNVPAGHFLYGDAGSVEFGGLAHSGLDAFVGHASGQTEGFLRGVDNLAAPVIFQYAPKPLHWVVLAVVWNVIEHRRHRATVGSNDDLERRSPNRRVDGQSL